MLFCDANVPSYFSIYMYRVSNQENLSLGYPQMASTDNKVQTFFLALGWYFRNPYVGSLQAN